MSALMVSIWDWSWEPSFWVTEAEITGRVTPQARPRACLDRTKFELTASLERQSYRKRKRRSCLRREEADGVKSRRFVIKRVKQIGRRYSALISRFVIRFLKLRIFINSLVRLTNSNKLIIYFYVK